jgi:hypothetical protein
LSEVTLLSGCARPPGWFIHKFTAITIMAPKIAVAATGSLLQMWAKQCCLVQVWIAAHHQRPALMCPEGLQKLDEHCLRARAWSSGRSQVPGHSAIFSQH